MVRFFVRKVFCMRKRWIWSLCLLGGGGVCVWAADWPSTSGNAQRSGWSQAETVLSKESVSGKQFQLLYKYKFENAPRGVNALSAPIDLGRLIGYAGFKELLIVGGSSDTAFALDSDLGTPYFKTRFDPIEKLSAAPATALCPGGMTANMVMPGTSGIQRFGGGGFGRLGLIWAVSSDGYLRTLRQQDGEAKMIPPTRFLPANSDVTGLNFNNNILYAATVNGCGGNPNGLYAAQFTYPELPSMPGQPLVKPAKFEVTSFMTNGSGFSGMGGTAIATQGGTVFGQVAEGHGDVAGTYNDTVLALDPKSLAVKDYFTPAEKMPSLKKDVEAPNVTPVVFSWNGKEVVVAGGRDGRLYLLDSTSLGGSDHHTPMSMTEPIVAPDANFGGSGIWGSFSTWVDSSNGDIRWLYAAIRGPAAMKFPTSNGPVSTGAIVAFQVETKDGKPSLSPQWISSDMVTPMAPVTANGVVFALSSGMLPRTAKKGGIPYSAAEMQKLAKSAVFYTLDAGSGKPLFTSGTAATSFASSGMAIANGRVYFTTHDNTVYAYGIPEER
jgi:hypothetical protein